MNNTAAVVDVQFINCHYCLDMSCWMDQQQKHADKLAQVGQGIERRDAYKAKIAKERSELSE